MFYTLSTYKSNSKYKRFEIRNSEIITYLCENVIENAETNIKARKRKIRNRKRSNGERIMRTNFESREEFEIELRFRLRNFLAFEKVPWVSLLLLLLMGIGF